MRHASHLLHEIGSLGHHPTMSATSANNPIPAATPSDGARFGAGLTEDEVRQLQTILRESCGLDVDLPEAWSRAIELLSLAEMLLQSQGVVLRPDASPAMVRVPSLLTDSPS